ncbi:MAG TPA: ABC transporter ATP-binding protein [Acidimicrobiales bacterium]|jgi:ABC-type branched-subunit amino acid transport system ATPase component
MLTADDITVSFGGVRAVSGVSLGVGADELVGLVGPNGSGKTTFLNAICGVVAAKGTLSVEDVDVALGHPRAAWRAGIARVFQAPQAFEALSCLENVLLTSADPSMRGLTGAWLARPVMWRSERRRWARAMESLDLVGLAHLATQPAALLTYGQRRLLELARALDGDPKVLLLDEPSAGLNDAETEALAELLREVRAGGIALLLIDHKVDFIDSLCDRIVVLELGKVIAEGPPEEVWRDRRVMSAYLGVRDDAPR